MKAGLDGPEGDAEVIGDLCVTEALEVGEQEDLPKRRRHAGKCTLHLAVAFVSVKGGVGGGDVDLHQIDERRGPLASVVTGLSSDWGRQLHCVPASLSTQVVASFVRRDGKKPGPKTPFGVERVGGEVNLEKGFLKNVFGGGFIAHEAVEEAEEVVAVALDEHAKRFGLATPITLEEHLV